MKSAGEIEQEWNELVDKYYQLYQKDGYLDLEGMEMLCCRLKGYFRRHCGRVPDKVKGLLEIACSLVDPNKTNGKIRLKKGLLMASGVSGVGMVAWAIFFFATMSWWSWGMALIFGIPMGPIAFGIAGIVLAALSAFILSSSRDKKRATQRALEVLKKGFVRHILPDIQEECKSSWVD